MTKELNALIANGTWTSIKLPARHKLITCKWVFRVKLQSNGLLERYKARLVARGFLQIKGVDYYKTFSLGKTYHSSCGFAIAFVYMMSCSTN